MAQISNLQSSTRWPSIFDLVAKFLQLKVDRSQYDGFKSTSLSKPLSSLLFKKET